jgi:hypothetical protein
MYRQGFGFSRVTYRGIPGSVEIVTLDDDFRTQRLHAGTLVRVVAFRHEHGAAHTVHAAGSRKRRSVVATRCRDDSHRPLGFREVCQQIDRATYLERADVLRVFKFHQGFRANPQGEQ